MLSANENMKNLEGLTGPLKERGPVIVANVDDSIANLNEMMRQLANFTNSLNSSEGAVGQFVHNPELYQRLDRAAANIERLTQEMRPVMHDVRVFTDKIANDPGVLGVRGAIRRNPGGKGG